MATMTDRSEYVDKPILHWLDHDPLNDRPVDLDGLYTHLSEAARKNRDVEVCIFDRDGSRIFRAVYGPGDEESLDLPELMQAIRDCLDRADSNSQRVELCLF